MYLGPSGPTQNVGELPSKPAPKPVSTEAPEPTKPEESGWDEDGWGEINVSHRNFHQPKVPKFSSPTTLIFKTHPHLKPCN
jgi:hypothetical protein